jgi:hypothetical protein
MLTGIRIVENGNNPSPPFATIPANLWTGIHPSEFQQFAD